MFGANHMEFMRSGKIYGLVSVFWIETRAAPARACCYPCSFTFYHRELPFDGSIITIDGNHLQASYEGGDGNDLTLTAVP
jgi:hypothetical protein